MGRLLRDNLARRGYEVAHAADAAGARQSLAAPDPFDVLVCDVRLGADDGLDFVEQLRDRAKEAGHAAPGVVVITAFGSVETAVRAFRAGAADFLTKPFEIEALALSVERVLESRRLRGEIQRLRREMDWRGRSDIVAASPQMSALVAMVGRIADSDATVLVTGPSGSGKEVLARALHDRSRRAEHAFVAINCAALPETLLESELFGYRRGAFTDARTSKDGLFKAADGGTLFLDELGEMPPALQPKLLRVLQSREFTPLGATRPERADVRVVAATNQDLEQLVADRRFREDLFYRVNVLRLEVPPLCARPEDVLPLAAAMLARLSARTGRCLKMNAAVEAVLMAYTWPGNVRELENAVEHAAALCEDGTLRAEHLPETVRSPGPSQIVEGAIARRLTVEQLVTEYCQTVVRHYEGNKAEALRHLGIDRKTLARRLRDEG